MRDVRPDELVVLEDGVPQQILSLRLRAAGEASGEAAGEEPPAAEAKPQPRRARRSRRAPSTRGSVNLVTLVFDQLGVDGRAIARRAGLALAGLTEERTARLGVHDPRAARPGPAVHERSGARGARRARGDRRARHAVRERDRDPAARRGARGRGPQDASRRSAPSPAPARRTMLASLGREVDMARMDVDALRMTDTLQREQQGQSSLYALLALARQQHRLAGRKTILFFSEGLQVPPNARARVPLRGQRGEPRQRQHLHDRRARADRGARPRGHAAGARGRRPPPRSARC